MVWTNLTFFTILLENLVNIKLLMLSPEKWKHPQNLHAISGVLWIPSELVHKCFKLEDVTKGSRQFLITEIKSVISAVGSSVRNVFEYQLLWVLNLIKIYKEGKGKILLLSYSLLT